MHSAAAPRAAQRPQQARENESSYEFNSLNQQKVSFIPGSWPPRLPAWTGRVATEKVVPIPNPSIFITILKRLDSMLYSLEPEHIVL